MHLSVALSLLCCLVCGRLSAQSLTAAQTRFLQQNAHSVCPDSQWTNPDWSALAAQIGDRRIVLLGEFNHGSKEIFQLRNDLIRYLHENKGFDVVLLESGLGEVARADLDRQSFSPGQMANSLIGPWRTAEFRDLMAYVQAEKMPVAGFDVQRSGDSFAVLLRAEAERRGLDTVLYAGLETRYSAARQALSHRKAQFDSVAIDTRLLIADYKRLRAILQLDARGETSPASLFLVRTLENRVAFLDYMLQFVYDRDWHRRWAARDSVMAQNVIWLAETVYPGRKLIVIAHNYHIARYNAREKVMGRWLADRYGPDAYTLGCFARTGVFANNAGQGDTLTAPDSARLDLKHLIGGMSGFAHFLPIPPPGTPGGEWLHTDITVNDTFIDLDNTNHMILARHFDGLLLLDKVSMPGKLVRDW